MSNGKKIVEKLIRDPHLQLILIKLVKIMKKHRNYLLKKLYLIKSIYKII